MKLTVFLTFIPGFVSSLSSHFPNDLKLNIFKIIKPIRSMAQTPGHLIPNSITYWMAANGYTNLLHKVQMRSLWATSRLSYYIILYYIIILYRKILIISPGLIFVQNAFLLGLFWGSLFSEGLVIGRNFAFQNEFGMSIKTAKNVKRTA